MIVSNEQLAAALYAACLRAAEEMGKDNIKKLSWFGCNQRAKQALAASERG